MANNILSPRIPNGSAQSSDPLDHLVQGLDPKLYEVFIDMRHFATLANDVLVHSSDKLQPETFHEIMLSIQYRLLSLSYSPEHQTLAEIVRAGLLAFHVTVFVKLSGSKFRSDFLERRLRSSLAHLQPSNPELADLRLWLVFVMSVTMFQGTEPWLVGPIRDLTAGWDWPQTRARLKSVMWIDLIYDVPAHQIFRATR